MIWVWVLIAVGRGAYTSGTMTVVDNIATAESCEVLRANLFYVSGGNTAARCVHVQKVAR